MRMMMVTVIEKEIDGGREVFTLRTQQQLLQRPPEQRLCS
jgi:hypothetical protein